MLSIELTGLLQDCSYRNQNGIRIKQEVEDDGWFTIRDARCLSQTTRIGHRRSLPRPQTSGVAVVVEYKRQGRVIKQLLATAATEKKTGIVLDETKSWTDSSDRSVTPRKRVEGQRCACLLRDPYLGREIMGSQVHRPHCSTDKVTHYDLQM